MSVLETIRKRAKFLVIAIGASLVIFVLEDALTSGRFLFGGADDAVAMINGKKIAYNDVRNKIYELEYYTKISKNETTLDAETSDNITQQAYSELIADKVLKPQFNMLGINVSDSEVVDLMLGPHPAPEVYQFFSDAHGKILKAFVDPRTGGLNTAMVINTLKQMTEQAQARWIMMEQKIKLREEDNKYFSLIDNGLFVTDAEAKQLADEDNKTYSIRYIEKKYSEVPDNAVPVSQADMDAWYKSHLNDFKQKEESRRIDYITFSFNPTEKDIKEIKKDVDSIHNEFVKLKPGEDSAFIAANSDVQVSDYFYHKQGTLDPLIDSVMADKDTGYIYGPYVENQQYRIARLLKIADMPDSVKLSQIVIAPIKGDWDGAKKMADSLQGMLTDSNFSDMASKYSADNETSKNGGDIGWNIQGADSRLIPEIEQKVFFADTGEVLNIKTNYGYHLILVTDKSPESRHIVVGIIAKNIEPSTETQQDAYGKASTFAGNNNTTAAFEKATSTMNRQVAEFTENDENIAGFQSPKELIRWVFDKKIGDVSVSPIDVGGDKLVIAHILDITPAGTKSREQVENLVKEKVLKEKKAEKIEGEFNTALQGAGSIAAVSQKTNIAIQHVNDITFQSYTIHGIGKEDVILGTMTALKPGSLSAPLKGEYGVYVIEVDSVSNTGTGIDAKMAEEKSQEELRQNALKDAYNVLKDKDGYINHLGRFF